MNRVSRLALASLAATLLLVGFGGYTRGSESGYGCEDRWPLCEGGLLGGLLPRADFHMIVEWTHRWIAAMVGLVVLALAVTAWRRRSEMRLAAWLSVAAVAVVGLQAWIGRLVVANDLDADLVSVHLGISMTIVGLLAAVGVLTGGVGTVGDRRWSTLLWVGALGSIVILMLGSYVHNLYVSGWPLVGNELFPNLGHRLVLVHFLHRLAAPLMLGFLVYLARRSHRSGRPVEERRLLWIGVLLFAVNIALGAAHVFTRVESSLVVASHLLIAALAWTVMVGVSVGSSMRPADR
ncbi:MAG TPA: COX15/CtaA family protein [Acidimicrobiia bacterium]|nr:COX15/CtaA family protein [Acidimicrobiia bacterium]